MKQMEYSVICGTEMEAAQLRESISDNYARLLQDNRFAPVEQVRGGGKWTDLVIDGLDPTTLVRDGIHLLFSCDRMRIEPNAYMEGYRLELELVKRSAIMAAWNVKTTKDREEWGGLEKFLAVMRRKHDSYKQVDELVAILREEINRHHEYAIACVSGLVHNARLDASDHIRQIFAEPLSV